MITPALTAHRLAKRQRLLIKAKLRKRAAPRRLSEAERQGLLRAWENIAGAGISMPMPRHEF